MANASNTQLLRQLLEQQHAVALQDKAQIEKRLVLLDQAKQRITNQTFGLCIDCQAGIDVKRLARLPFVQRCLPCQIQHEQTAG